jgi:hypothetical protein
MANLIEQMEILKGLTDDHLAAEMHAPSGGVAPFMVASELSRRKDMRKRYADEAARTRPNRTVMEDLMGGFPAPAQAAPQGIEGYAAGGTVGASTGIAAAGTGYEDLIKKYQERLDSLPAEREKAAALALIAAGAGIMGAGHSNTLQNVGIGATAGLKSYGDQLNIISGDEEDALRGLSDIGRSQHQEALQAAANAASYSQTPVFLVDADGKSHTGQMASTGGIFIDGKMYPGVPPGWRITARPENFDIVDTGDAKRVWNPNTGQFENVAAVVQGAPSSNQNVVLTPEGERTMEAAPGSPEAIAAQEKIDNAAATQATAAMYADVVTQDIDRAKTLIEGNPGFTTGFGGAIGQHLPAGPAVDVSRLIDTVKSNIGFDRLQEMRQNSPTGGALGPVSDFENKLLQATIGNLELSQNKEQLLFNLERVKKIYTKIVNEGVKESDPEAAVILSTAAAGTTPTKTKVTWSVESD